MADQYEALKVQAGLAVAALGLAFAQTLASDDTPPGVLTTLRKRSQEVFNRLKADGALDAAAIFGEFVHALNENSNFQTHRRSHRHISE